jgi:hypothetical protein
MTIPTPTELAGLLERATATPWKADMNVGMDMLAVYPDRDRQEFAIAEMPNIIRHEVNAANAALIVAAVNALPSLLARIKELKEALEPFAAKADKWEANHPTAQFPHANSRQLTHRVGDFRYARFTLNKDSTHG